MSRNIQSKKEIYNLKDNSPGEAETPLPSSKIEDFKLLAKIGNNYFPDFQVMGLTVKSLKLDD